MIVDELRRFGCSVAEATEAAARASSALRAFGVAFQTSNDQELAQHPDMAELNVQMDGFYGDDSRG